MPMPKDAKGDSKPDFVMNPPTASSQASSRLLAAEEVLPKSILLIPVAHATLFPGMVAPLIIPEGKLTKTAEHVLETGGSLGIVFTRNPEIPSAAGGNSNPFPLSGPTLSADSEPRTEPSPEKDFYEYGVAAKILKKINLPDNQVSILLTGTNRFRIKELIKRDPHFVAEVEYLYEQLTQDTELEALVRSAVTQFKQLSKDNPLISDEVKVALINIDGPGKLADFMASILVRNVEEYQKMLSLIDVKTRLHHLLLLLKKEQDVQDVQKKIQDNINLKISNAQREYYLSEQLKLIQKELGAYSDNKTKLLDKFTKRLEGKKLGTDARNRIDEEIEKLTNLHEQSSEYSVCINYLDWATSLPWGVRSQENFDLGEARRVLEQDHYGLKEAKERILEFLAVRKLKNSSEGSIICFVGAPGTGKTSLGRSIARALDRKFFRFSVGGMRDEAEIKGHRRTYVGAMPGKIIQGLKRVGTQNPVILIDEVDKMGTSWASGGDPAAALLEVLDPEQNSEFLDHYLDIPFDCSEILFITTANTADGIPSALVDRMEVIPLHGYSDIEKFHIAKQYLIPKQFRKNALKRSSLRLTDSSVRHIITHYAREAGVRALEKHIAKICRKVAYRIASGRSRTEFLGNPKKLERYLGKPPFAPDLNIKHEIPGVATGLAWTHFGGEVLSVESVALDGKGTLTLTGQLGNVMQESANIAYSIVRHRASRFSLPKNYFDKHNLHVHVPAGATPKDGPSAGITMAASLFSLISKKPLRQGLAMTGELTLSGRVLPVGGIKEKILAARRAKIETIILPKDNEKDLKELESELRRGMRFIKVSTLDDCLRHIF